MQRFLVLLIFLAIRNPIQAQSSFSFNCVKDTLIDCTIPCITLHTTLPDIYSSTTSYTVNPTCFKPYVSPAAPGPSANLTIDDRYSPLIDITFPFSFYGNTYTKLAASTNGFLTFDNTKATMFSHYGILANGALLSSTTGTPQDLPSSLYDGAIIMGPYHDLDPNNATSALQMKYDVVGTAPYRKWILSYYNVPLYTTACLNLATNTHQIVLYETLGIVEVFIYDKEICLNWNNGRSMIGMQNMSKSSAIIAPGRRATSAPWGSKGMNESWRFVPASGSSLLDRVELYTLSGAFVAKGITSPLPNNMLDVSFSNVCPPAAGDIYIVKSYYKDPNGSGNQVIGTDTINVTRGESITANISPAGCSAGTTGTVSITSPVGAGYEYSIDGSTWQALNVFTVPAGSYLVRARIAGSNCISSKSFTVATAPLDASTKVTPTLCSGPPSGSITVFPVKGSPPYSYSLNGGGFQTSNVFSNLGVGTYTILIKDAFGCTFTTIDNINTIGPSFSGVVKHAQCGGSGAGSITISVSTGIAPFTFSIDSGPFQTSNIFTGLSAGVYDVTVKDATGCTSMVAFTVNSEVVFKTDVLMKMPSCFGNNNGSITVNTSGLPFLYAINGNSYKMNNLFDSLLAGTYVLHIKDTSGCIKDTTVILNQPNEFKITYITTIATTCASLDGQITVKANGGTTPYQYSIDNGKTFTVNNTFTTRSGIYSLVVKDNNGCIATDLVTVDALTNNMILDIGPDKTLCQGDSIDLTPVVTPPADFFKWSPAAGLNDTTAAVPKASPSDTITYYLTARTGACAKKDSITINVLRKPIVDAGADTSICFNSSARLNGKATNTSGNVSYLWLPAADIANPSLAITTVRPKSSGPNIYKLQVSDNYGCNFKVYDQVTVKVNQPVAAFAGNDTVATAGIPLQLNGSGGTKYFWSPSNVLNNPLLADPIAILQNDTKFSLLVRDTLGCIGTSGVLVKVYNSVRYYIPNAFTPNGDGMNDEFKVVAPGIQRTFYFRVFNRWGHMMFDGRDTKKGWDGTYGGVPQPPAVYVWMIKGVDVLGKVIELKGTVTLIR